MNIAVAQSGGATCVINSSLAGVIKEAKLNLNIEKIYGSKNGIDGVINNRFCDLGEIFFNDDNLTLLRKTPAAALGSCRIRLEPSQYASIFETFKKRNIGAFFYIGGNDSMDTVSKLHDYAVKTNFDIKFVGIPKTIDNDLPETDHTPGFGSAAKYLAVTVKEIIRDSNIYNTNSVTIVEIMGRDTGWLTASVSVLRNNQNDAPHLIYLPENPFSINQFFSDIAHLHESGTKAVIIAVAEGLKDKNGEYIGSAAQSGKNDIFGHKYLAGLGKFLENKVSENIGCKVRSIELNVCQRCASHIASVTDLNEAEAVAAAGVRAAVSGNQSGVMMTIQRVCNSPYNAEYKPVDVKLCANREKFFPLKWVNSESNNILPEAKGYFMPLIQGEVDVRYENGIPVHFCIDDGMYS